ncbi:MAG TPA: CBS domain-containing protein [Acidimicrobiales bacterium]|nr:CBS domain-containing protein [Acidimicrobiales bacterium]
MLVRTCLRFAPVTVPPQSRLEEAAQLMAEHEVGSLLVVSGGELIGIVTDRDIAVRGVGRGLPGTSTVEAVMTAGPTTIDGSADIHDAFRMLKDHDVRRLPVLEDGDLAGIITLDDLLVSIALEFAAALTPVANELVRPH